jgi:TRAP-type mannitol/chloroaromatic compound transport system substrate-binding protein
MLSNRSSAVAVATSFIVGLVGSLALRPSDAQPENTQASAATFQNETQNRIHWRVPISSSTNLPVIGDNATFISITADQVSDGAIQLDIYEPGEIVPSLAVSDAVRDGKVPAGYTWLGYDQGKIPAAALIAAVPFGMEPWEFSAWWYEAGGRELGETLYQPHNIHPIYCGMTGPETAGWFRKPINELEDLEGLKIRFAGLGGKVMERLGASITMLPSGEIFQALEKGAIDATEFALPIVDQALGFDRVAKINYFPGWHQPSTATHLIVNLDVWQSLADVDQHLLNTSCTAAVTRNLAQSEALQGAVIAGFPDKGVTATHLPVNILREMRRVTEELLAEEAQKNEPFNTILNSQKAFQKTYAHWKRLAYLPRDF